MDLKNMIPGGAGEEQAPEQRLSKEEYAAMKNSRGKKCGQRLTLRRRQCSKMGSP